MTLVSSRIILLADAGTQKIVCLRLRSRWSWVVEIVAVPYSHAGFRST